ncbi:MAG: ABC transporter permease [Caldilineaceae bacterium]|nr:ABC transporter permease [Caldilineaceae bacterium]
MIQRASSQPSSQSSPRAIFRLAWRHSWRRPLQSLFLIAGVAIGVAMIVAIDLANGSAQRAFALGTETVAGRATHTIIGGPSGLDEQVYTDLRRNLGIRMSAPVVESYLVVEELDRQPMRLLGVDPFAESPFRSYLGTDRNEPAPDFLTTLMVQPNTVLLSSEIAARYALQPGDTLTAIVGSSRHTLEIAGLLEPSDDLSRRALDSLLLTDIGTAQELLDRVGRLDRIDLIMPDTPAGEADLERIAASLPPGARIEPSSARAGTVSEMTAAFGLNLTALSLLALVVGMFLIYNTVTFSVVQRRRVIGTLRSLGMTRREVYGMILLEAVLLGLLGTLAGLGLGVLLGRGAVQLVTRTINDLFFVVSVREIEIPLLTLVKGTLIGLAAAIVAAAIPAYEATSVAPAGALQRSNIEERSRRVLPWISVAALLLLVIGGLLLIPEWSLVIAFAGLFVIIIAAALLAPSLTLSFMLAIQRITGAVGGVIGRMAPRTIVRTLSRTSVAVAALMVAVSVIIGVGVMISSFRTTVELWLDDVLQADIFISPPSLNANQVLTTLEPQIVADLASYPGVSHYATTRGVNTAIFLGGDDQALPVRLIALSEDLAGADRRYRAAVGDWQETWAAAEAGGAIINEPIANRYDIGVGDELTVQTDRGRHNFPVVGIAVDFDVNPVIFLHDPVYRQWWDDDGISGVGLFVEPGRSVDEMVAELRAAFGSRAELLISSNRGMRENALNVFDRTFAITIALQLLATLVAFIGILSTLMSLQLERVREIGVLRATGMTRRQLWRLSLLETGLIGASAGLLAMPTGYVLSLVLIYIINLRSFGWTLEMRLDPMEFVQAFLVAVGAALVAGLYPAWRMGRIPPAEAVRAE